MSDNAPVTNTFGLHLCDDLMFTSRVAGTALDLGFEVQTAKNWEQLAQMASARFPACVVLDLASPGLDVRALIARVGELGAPRPTIVAYGSHVDTATLSAARAAGCDRVMPRSQFVQELPKLLHEGFAPKSQ